MLKDISKDYRSYTRIAAEKLNSIPLETHR